MIKNNFDAELTVRPQTSVTLFAHIALNHILSLGRNPMKHSLRILWLAYTKKKGQL